MKILRKKDFCSSRVAEARAFYSASDEKQDTIKIQYIEMDLRVSKHLPQLALLIQAIRGLNHVGKRGHI